MHYGMSKLDFSVIATIEVIRRTLNLKDNNGAENHVPVLNEDPVQHRYITFAESFGTYV